MSDPIDPMSDLGVFDARGQPDPTRVRHAAEEVIGLIHRRGDSSQVESLLELVGHEIRTPLAVIEGTARVVMNDADELSDDHLDAVGRIHANALLALLLLERLAEVRPIEEGRVTLVTYPTDLIRQLVQTVELLGHAVLGTRPVSVHHGELESVICDVDPRRLRQIVFNLLANAALNTPPGSPINVDVRTDGGVAEVEVRDDGQGVTPEDAERLFEKFPSLTAHRQGPGVGLFVSRGLARAHGGDLRAVPTEGGPGGVFILQLPLSAPPDAPADQR